MQDITCPNCKTSFKLDEAGYADIQKQVRDSEFEKAVNDLLAKEQEKRNLEIQVIESKANEEKIQELAKKEEEIARLKGELDNSEMQKQLAEASIIQAKAEEVSLLQSQIQKLEAQISQFETQKELAVTKATSELEKQRDQAKAEVLQIAQLKKDAEQTLKENYEAKVRILESAISDLKSMKAGQGSADVGAELEKWCENTFNAARAGTFPRAYFEKDNEVVDGGKGDYVFRDFDETGLEYVSIMFEMKNEQEETTKKQKNDKFFAKLDKDRKAKGCEFAILVSTLEAESELYNSGIVDVSHKYPKMYVVRPQFFLPMITLLRNASMNTLTYKKELEIVKLQNVDAAAFQEKFNVFRKGFSKNYELASRQFDDAIDAIDDAIADLEKTKDLLKRSVNNLRLANEKAQTISIKKLTAGNETMRKKFEEIGIEEELEDSEE